LDFARLSQALVVSSQIKKTNLTDEFEFQAFRAKHGEAAIVLFVIKTNGLVQVRTVDDSESLVPGDTIISIVPNENQSPKTPATDRERDPEG